MLIRLFRGWPLTLAFWRWNSTNPQLSGVLWSRVSIVLQMLQLVDPPSPASSAEGAAGSRQPSASGTDWLVNLDRLKDVSSSAEATFFMQLVMTGSAQSLLSMVVPVLRKSPRMLQALLFLILFRTVIDCGEKINDSLNDQPPPARSGSTRPHTQGHA